MKKECYGEIFPDILHVAENQELSSKVFSMMLSHRPINISSEKINCDLDEWEECLKCEFYRSCYELSMAKLTFTIAAKVSVK